MSIVEFSRFDALIEQVHSVSISDPLVAGSSFACAMHLDPTIKGHGWVTNHELCLYEVKDDRIVSEQFTSRFPGSAQSVRRSQGFSC